MKELEVHCTHDGGDTLILRPAYHNGSIVAFEGTGEAIWATPEDARRVRDALDEALREHDEKQRAAKWAQWEALREPAMWERPMGGYVAVMKVNAESRTHVESGPNHRVAHIYTGQYGISLEAQQLDEVIEKLTAIRDAHRALMEAR